MITPIEPLAPCPFCGGAGMAKTSLRDGCLDGEPDAWCGWVTCRSCATVGPWAKATTIVDAERRGRAAWSRRAVTGCQHG